jgi:hypothetical protein
MNGLLVSQPHPIPLGFLAVLRQTQTLFLAYMGIYQCICAVEPGTAPAACHLSVLANDLQEDSKAKKACEHAVFYRPQNNDYSVRL